MNRLLIGALALALGSIPVSANSEILDESHTTSKSIVLHGSVHPQSLLAADNGVVSPSTRITAIQLYLAPTPAQHAALSQLMSDQRNPRSKHYQKWLTPAQFGWQFGVSTDVEAELRAWIASNGFEGATLSASRTVFTFSGYAWQVANGFGIQIHRLTIDNEEHFGNLSEINVPTSLAGVIQGVRGLNDFHLKPHLVRMNRNSRPEFSGPYGTLALAPGDIAAIYDMQPLYDSGIDGTGVTAAVIGQADINLTDIAAYRGAFNLPAQVPTLVLVPTSADPGTYYQNPDEAEANLDLDMISAVARNANLTYVYGTDALHALQYAIDQNLAPVISFSYGSCEVAGDTANIGPASEQFLAEQASVQGITIVAASGDYGAASCDGASEAAASSGLLVDYPADVPEITGVGGTSFINPYLSYFGLTNDPFGGSASSYIPEEAWAIGSPTYPVQGSGGGASVVFPKPAWQVGNGVPNDGSRDVPDVALFAGSTSTQNGDGLGYLICTWGNCAGGSPNLLNNGASYGGTSASTPVFAGMVILLNHYLIANGKLAAPGLGNINPSLYLMAQNTSDVFHDITQGNNIVPCVIEPADYGCNAGAYGYNAGSGYDEVTGLGSVDALHMITEWSNYTVTGTILALTPSVSPVVSGVNINQTLEVKVTTASGVTIPSGNVIFYEYVSTAEKPASIIGTVTLDNSGTASFALDSIDPSINRVYAVYMGNAEFGQSMSELNVSLSVVQPDLILTPPLLALSVIGGQDVNTTISVNAVNVVVQNIIWSCSGQPLGSTCMFGSPIENLNGAYTVPLTISTLALSADVKAESLRGAPFLAILPFVAIFSIKRKGSVLKILRLIVLITMLAVVDVGLTACGSYAGTPKLNSLVSKTSIITVAATTLPGISYSCQLTLVVK